MPDRTCTISGCERAHCARGLCKKHYYAAGHGFTPHPCRIPGCPDETHPKSARGLCANHYKLLNRTGKTTTDNFHPRRGASVADVLFTRSAPHGDCVLWTGALNKQNYPVAVSGGPVAEQAHRASWRLANGPVPDGMTIDHVCHTTSLDCPGGKACLHRRCINPDHLEVVTGAENTRRRDLRTLRM